MRQAKIKIRILKFRKTNTQLFRELFNKTSWNSVLKDRGAEQSFRIALFPQVEEVRKGRQEISMAKPGPVVKLERKKKMHRQEKQGQVP